MLSYKEALSIIHKEGGQKRLRDEIVDVSAIAGRICAADVVSPVANQPFDNSAMDGFALKAADLSQVSKDNPASLQLIDQIAAGNTQAFAAPGAGQCYAIMTGAPIPPGCDAVVPVEKTEKAADGKILFRVPVGVGENIRRTGEDFAVGDRVLERGMLLKPGHVLALATLGIGQVPVLQRPKIALISTGPELVEDFGAPLKPGQIYNSTKPYVQAVLAESGIETQFLGTATDDPKSFRDKISAMVDGKIDIGLSTGAVSAGAHDFVPSVLKEMGAEILFHKVAMRPGKPMLLAKFPGDGPFFFGLPGNPAASAAGLRFFVAPIIRAMQGLPPEEPQYAVLETPYRKGDLPLRFFMQAVVRHTEEGILVVEIPQKQPSFMVSPFTVSNAWAVIPEDVTQLNAGDLVQVCQ